MLKAIKQPWFIIVPVLIMVILSVAFLGASEEEFIVMAILNEDYKAERYLPDNSNVHVNMEVRWYIYVENRFFEAKNVSVRIKLLNSSLPGPNDFTNEPSPIESLINLDFSMSAHETRLSSFNWTISDVTFSSTSLTVNKLIVNNRQFPVSISAIPESSFRFVFEMWIFNQQTQEYDFQWTTKQTTYSVWTQIWFSITS